ncbi:MAG: class I tRNA ligase family protein, partial [Armatimonadetes bacterium]|nr:class I tRNA ligase family protein [Armatimonadota bacterium]
TADRWILSRHQKVLAEVNRRLDRYDLAEAAGTLYEHVWNEFCDWYVELAKIALYSDDPARKQHTQAMLSGLLSSILRAQHPFMPFITEEIWQRWRPQDGPIALQAYPLADDALMDDAAEAKMALMQEVLSGVRSVRGDFGIPRGTKVAVTLVAQDAGIAEALAPEGPAFRLLADVSELSVLTAPAQAPGGTVPGMAAGVELYLHLGDAVDVAAELARVDKQVAAAEKDIQRAEGKLRNEKFTANAPEAVVAKERAILEEARATLGKLQAQRAALEALGQ